MSMFIVQRLLLLSTLLLLCCRLFHANADDNDDKSSLSQLSLSRHATESNHISFIPHTLKLEMSSVWLVKYTLKLDPSILDKIASDIVTLSLTTTTLSPQFNILSIGPTETSHDEFSQTLTVSIPKIDLRGNNDFTYNSTFAIQSTYIGRGVVRAALNLSQQNLTTPDKGTVLGHLDVVSTREDGALSKIFKVSAILLVVINFFNLGTQIQDENLVELWKSPMISLLGLIITLTVMPLVSWTLGYFLLRDQLYYRFGAFLIGCCPAASASSFWVLLLKGDTELAVTLVLLSTIGAMITMPVWLYTLGDTITQDQYIIKVPYGQLVGTLLSLLFSLVVGYMIGKYSKKFSAFVRRVIKPFSFMVLAFFIIFSSIVYWFIYRMFDWKMILLGMAISFLTYLISATTGFLINRKVGHLITVSISATHKSSGIAFAVLLVALPDPDYYVAFVPCLAQVLATRSILYSVLTVRAIANNLFT